MNNEIIEENFSKCIEFIRSNKDSIGNNPLYIGFGNDDFSHPWNKGKFFSREYCVEVNANEVPVAIERYGCTYMETYGYEKDVIERWKKGYEGTGMRCPDFKHTFDELDICIKEKFLRDWREIKERLLERVEEMNKIENFVL